MKTYSDKTKTYIGRNAGEELAEEISNAKKSIKIVSPYLSPSYVETLLKLAKEGVSVTLITCNEIEKDRSGNYSNLRDTDIIKQERIMDEEKKKKRTHGINYSWLGIILSLIITFAYSYPIGGIALAISILTFIYFHQIIIYSYNYYSPIRLRVVPDKYHDKSKGKYLIHSKLFVIDERVAFVGSVNYTYSGFKKSYEVLTRIKTYNAVLDISKEIERLFYDSNLYSKPIEEWGKELYAEPRN